MQNLEPKPLKPNLVVWVSYTRMVWNRWKLTLKFTMRIYPNDLQIFLFLSKSKSLGLGRVGLGWDLEESLSINNPNTLQRDQTPYQLQKHSHTSNFQSRAAPSRETDTTSSLNNFIPPRLRHNWNYHRQVIKQAIMHSLLVRRPPPPPRSTYK